MVLCGQQSSRQDQGGRGVGHFRHGGPGRLRRGGASPEETQEDHPKGLASGRLCEFKERETYPRGHRGESGGGSHGWGDQPGQALPAMGRSLHFVIGAIGSP